MKSLKPSERKLLHRKYNGRCAYCGCKIDADKFHVDHIKPLQRQYNKITAEKHNVEKGENNINNYNPSCIVCNSSKNSLSLEEWRNHLEEMAIRLNKYDSTFRLMVKYKVVKVKKYSIKFYFEKIKNNKEAKK